MLDMYTDISFGLDCTFLSLFVSINHWWHFCMLFHYCSLFCMLFHYCNLLCLGCLQVYLHSHVCHSTTDDISACCFTTLAQVHVSTTETCTVSINHWWLFNHTNQLLITPISCFPLHVTAYTQWWRISECSLSLSQSSPMKVRCDYGCLHITTPGRPLAYAGCRLGINDCFKFVFSFLFLGRVVFSRFWGQRSRICRHCRLSTSCPLFSKIGPFLHFGRDIFREAASRQQLI